MILDSTLFKIEQAENLKKKMEFYNCERGEKEIFNLIVDAKLFEEISEKDIPLRNYAIRKLTELGFNMEFKIREAIHEMLQKEIPLERITGDTDGND